MSGAVMILENAGSLRWLLPELGWLALVLGLWVLAAGGRRADRAAPWLAAAGLAAVLAAGLPVRRPDRVLLAEGVLVLDAARLAFRLVLGGMGIALLLAPARAARPGAAACARLAAALLVLDLLAGTADLVLAAALLAAWLPLASSPAAGARVREPASPGGAAAPPAAGRALPGGALALAVFLHGAVWVWAAAGRTGPGAGSVAAAGGSVAAAAALAAAGGLVLLGRPLGLVLTGDRPAPGRWRPLLAGLAGLAAGAFCLFRLLDVLGGGPPSP